jgi:hypothetical protein
MERDGREEEKGREHISKIGVRKGREREQGWGALLSLSFSISTRLYFASLFLPQPIREEWHPFFSLCSTKEHEGG